MLLILIYTCRDYFVFIGGVLSCHIGAIACNKQIHANEEDDGTNDSADHKPDVLANGVELPDNAPHLLVKSHIITVLILVIKIAGGVNLGGGFICIRILLSQKYSLYLQK